MRPILCLFLIGLAVRCYEANNGGMVCKAVLNDLRYFLIEDKEKLEEFLTSYSPPQEAIDAKMLVKECVDKMNYIYQLIVAGTLKKLLRDCGVRRWLPNQFSIIMKS